MGNHRPSSHRQATDRAMQVLNLLCSHLSWREGVRGVGGGGAKFQ